MIKTLCPGAQRIQQPSATAVDLPAECHLPGQKGDPVLVNGRWPS